MALPPCRRRMPVSAARAGASGLLRSVSAGASSTSIRTWYCHCSLILMLLMKSGPHARTATSAGEIGATWPEPSGTFGHVGSPARAVYRSLVARGTNRCETSIRRRTGNRPATIDLAYAGDRHGAPSDPAGVSSRLSDGRDAEPSCLSATYRQRAVHRRPHLRHPRGPRTAGAGLDDRRA